ncbi:MAG: hypothetical protein ABJF04_01865 [Reichenbachiella sp.]|uniref:hypothetical protein n=1 Tax=Reichenbachiella sp. TaxID=2184521 RepID=UPI003266EEAF
MSQGGNHDSIEHREELFDQLIQWFGIYLLARFQTTEWQDSSYKPFSFLSTFEIWTIVSAKSLITLRVTYLKG